METSNRNKDPVRKRKKMDDPYKSHVRSLMREHCPDILSVMEERVGSWKVLRMNGYLSFRGDQGDGERQLIMNIVLPEGYININPHLDEDIASSIRGQEENVKRMASAFL